MLIELITTLLNITVDIIEGLMLALIGVKPPRRARTTRRRTYQRHKREYAPVVYRPAAPRLYVVKKAA